MISSSDRAALLTVLPGLGPRLDGLAEYFTPSVFSPRTTLLREGDIAERLYFITKGSARTYLISDDGRETTTQFFFEGQMVASMQSFLSGKPSRCYLETIEETKTLVVKKRDFAFFMYSDTAKDMLLSFLKERLFYYQDLHTAYILDSPEARYINLLEQHPNIIDRIPHYDIASYLGITPVSLSRIRSRRKKRADINKG